MVYLATSGADIIAHTMKLLSDKQLEAIWESSTQTLPEPAGPKHDVKLTVAPCLDGSPASSPAGSVNGDAAQGGAQQPGFAHPSKLISVAS